MRRWWPFLSLVVAVLAAGCGEGSTPSPAAAPKPTETRVDNSAEVPIEVVTPQARMRRGILETSGKVQFNEETVTRVHSPVTGRVVEVLTKPGDVVEAGHALFVIEGPDLGQAKSDYSKAITDVERADRALRLAKELFEVKAIPQKEIRETESDYRKAVAERERAASRLRTLGMSEAQIADAGARSDTTTRLVVHAPRSGVVVERNIVPGQVVAYGQSDTPVNLFVIADLSTMWVLADVYEPDISRIQRDQPVTVTLPCCPGERFEGRVSYISDIVDKDTRTIKVRAVVPNRGRLLKAEMFVKVAIATGASRVLALPSSAIHREQNQLFVLVQKGKDEYERRPVKVGEDVNGSVEVLGGVGPTDRVVTTGSILLKRSVK
jgi:cobalt-zinc-cadmium efflux system membrane fusion protein